MEKMFVALAGNIGSGKTSAAKMISQHFGYELFDEPVIDNRFLEDYYGEMRRWSFTLQLEFLMKRVQHHELIERVPKSCIQDRTLLEDPEVFAKYLHGLGHMTSKELDLYFEYFHKLNAGIRQPDKVICLVVDDVRVLMKRIATRARAMEKSISADFLRGLNGYYQALPQILKSKYRIEVLTIDVSNVDIRSAGGKTQFLETVGKFVEGSSTAGRRKAPNIAVASRQVSIKSRRGARQ